MDDSRATAERIVGERLGAQGHLVDPVVLREIEGHALVVRYRLNDGTSVVVKRPRSVAVTDADPKMFLDEWAALELLTSLNLDHPVAPTLLGGDRDSLVIVLEDLGDGPSLVESLLGADPRAATSALEGFARCLGRLHAATADQAGSYAKFRGQLGAKGDHWLRFDRALAGFTDACATFGVDVPADASADVAAFIGRLKEPQPFLALVHGDPCPDNVRGGHSLTRLFDFDGSRFRHCLIDTVYWWVPFPSCWCANRLPRDVSLRLDDVYRAELAPAIREAEDDGAFISARLDAWAMWTVASTSLLASMARDTDQEWGIASVRQRLVARWEDFLEECDRLGALPNLMNVGTNLLARARQSWPDVEALPLYPAFRNSSP